MTTVDTISQRGTFGYFRGWGQCRNMRFWTMDTEVQFETTTVILTSFLEKEISVQENHIRRT